MATSKKYVPDATKPLLLVIPRTSGTADEAEHAIRLRSLVHDMIVEHGFVNVLRAVADSANSSVVYEQRRAFPTLDDEEPEPKPSTKATKKVPSKKAPAERTQAITVTKHPKSGATWEVDLSKPQGQGIIEKMIAKAGWEIVEVIGHTLPTYTYKEIGLVRYFLVKHTDPRFRNETLAVLRFRQHPVAGGVSLTTWESPKRPRKVGGSYKVEAALRALLSNPHHLPSRITHNTKVSEFFESLREENPFSSKQGAVKTSWRKNTFSHRG